MKLDYELPAKEKDLDTTLDYQNTNTGLSQPVTPVNQSEVDPVTSQVTGGQKLN